MRTKNTNIGSLVRYIRTRYGWSQAQLAHCCGLSPNDICRIERGELSIHINKFRQLATYLGIRVHDILHNDYANVLPGLGAYVRKPGMAKRLCRIAEKRAQTGETGEALVLRWEKEKLAGSPYENGVNGGYADDPDAGFDIISFRSDGTPIYIEVKSTVGDLDESFYLTASEKSFMEYCVANGHVYELHRVYHLSKKGRGKRVIYTGEELMSFAYEVDTYRVRRRR